jgi:hypothetical protein
LSLALLHQNCSDLQAFGLSGGEFLGLGMANLGQSFGTRKLSLVGEIGISPLGDFPQLAQDLAEIRIF